MQSQSEFIEKFGGQIISLEPTIYWQQLYYANNKLTELAPPILQVDKQAEQNCQFSLRMVRREVQKLLRGARGLPVLPPIAPVMPPIALPPTIPIHDALTPPPTGQ
jgi:hypothetical protein